MSVMIRMRSLYAWTLEAIGAFTGWFGMSKYGGLWESFIALSVSALCFWTASNLIRVGRGERQFERTKNWEYYLFVGQGIVSAALAALYIPGIVESLSW